MTRHVAILSVSALALLGPLTVPALAAETLHTHLNGYQETLLTISTGAAGDFRAKISADESSVAYELSYDGLEGNVQQAHIHFGAAWQSGGISVFFCTNLGNSPGTRGGYVAGYRRNGLYCTGSDSAARSGVSGRIVYRATGGDPDGQHAYTGPH